MPPSPPPPDDLDELRVVLADLRPDGAAWPPPSWLRLLFRGEDAPFDLILSSARAAPAEAVPWLAAILDDDDLSYADSVGEGRAPTMAAEVLGAVPEPAGIDALIRVVARTEGDDDLHTAAVEALEEIGEAAIEPLVAARATFSWDSIERDMLTAAIACLPGPDPRIREVLLEALEDDAERAAPLCALSQDPELIPSLRARWDAYDVTASDDDEDAMAAGAGVGQALVDLGAPWTADDAAKLAASFDRLGWTMGDGQLEPRDDDLDDDEADEREFLAEDLREILDDAGRLKRPDGAPLAPADDSDDRAVDPLVRREAPGRNDPCWCGSGKKYKKCHLDADGGEAE